jgi:hypothetical protein
MLFLEDRAVRWWSKAKPTIRYQSAGRLAAVRYWVVAAARSRKSPSRPDDLGPNTCGQSLLHALQRRWFNSPLNSVDCREIPPALRQQPRSHQLLGFPRVGTATQMRKAIQACSHRGAGEHRAYAVSSPLSVSRMYIGGSYRRRNGSDERAQTGEK